MKGRRRRLSIACSAYSFFAFVCVLIFAGLAVQAQQVGGGMSSLKGSGVLTAVESIADTANDSQPFKGKIDRMYENSKEWWPEEPKPRPGTPNVLLILLDDVGYSELGSYGGLIETPNIDALAKNGLRFTNFHSTPLCTPSRVSILSVGALTLLPAMAYFLLPRTSVGTRRSSGQAGADTLDLGPESRYGVSAV